MANVTASTASRRAARKAVKQSFAAAGIVLDESQARYVWSTGLTVQEYQELRKAFGLHQPGIAERKAAIRRTRAYRAAGTLGTASLITGKAATATEKFAYMKHIAQPGGDSAWVDPKGTFYRVNFTGHESFATKCHEAGVITAASKYGSYVPVLEQAGWIHISGHMIRNRVEAITGEQVHTLIKWAATSPLADKVVRAYLSA